VIVGGMLLSPICSLIVIPTLARMFMPFVPNRAAMPPDPQAAEPGDELPPSGTPQPA
jgi:hypothetical protein